MTWAFLERVVPRVVSAVATLAITPFVAPAQVGVYAWGIVLMTLFLAGTDAPVNQVAVSAVRSSDGRRFLHRYRTRTSWAGIVWMLAGIGALSVFLPPGLQDDAVALLPLALVPLACALRAQPVAMLQARHQWRALARFQFIASVVSMLAFGATFLVTRSIWATAMQTLVMETVYAIATVIAVRRLGSSVDPVSEDAAWRAADYRHVAIYSVLGWLQGQADRVLLGFLAGPARLGVYTLSLSMSRNLGDGVSMSTANVLRPRIMEPAAAGGPADDTETRRTSDAILIKATWLSAAVVVATIIGANTLLEPVLGAQWAAAVDLVGILSICTLATTLSWSLAVIMIAIGRVRFAVPVRILGIVGAVPIALAAQHDLVLAAWLAVGREVVLLALMIVICGRWTPWRSVVLTGVLILVFSALQVSIGV